MLSTCIGWMIPFNFGVIFTVFGSVLTIQYLVSGMMANEIQPKPVSSHDVNNQLLNSKLHSYFTTRKGGEKMCN